MMHFDVYFDKIWYKNDRFHIENDVMCTLAIGVSGHTLIRKFRKIKRFGVCFNQILAQNISKNYHFYIEIYNDFNCTLAMGY